MFLAFLSLSISRDGKFALAWPSLNMEGWAYSLPYCSEYLFLNLFR
jgi:hypothetical protein